MVSFGQNYPKKNQLQVYISMNSFNKCKLIFSTSMIIRSFSCQAPKLLDVIMTTTLVLMLLNICFDWIDV